MWHVDGHLLFSGDSLAWDPERERLTGLPAGLLVLVGRPDRVARPLRPLGPALRPAVLRARVEPRRTGRDVPRPPRRPRRADAGETLRRSTRLTGWAERDGRSTTTDPVLRERPPTTSTLNRDGLRSVGSHSTSLPPDEQTARSEPWSAVTVECELPCLGVDFDRAGTVEILELGIARGVRPLAAGVGVRTGEPGSAGSWAGNDPGDRPTAPQATMGVAPGEGTAHNCLDPLDERLRSRILRHGCNQDAPGLRPHPRRLPSRSATAWCDHRRGGRSGASSAPPEGDGRAARGAARRR